ncbi:TPA: MSHA biogenesis protein MshQ [Vibrio alginolyticus]|nr:MSHA biogenesis protein MshQ [Vibrio alginolyticus]
MKKIIISLLAVALFLFSSISFAAVNNNPQFEFGTIPAENCKVLNNERGVTCDIEFQNTYDEEPLVFVMSTIDASMSNFADKRTEYPSNLRIWSKSKTQATVKQLFPPHSAACKRLKQNNNGKWRCTDNNNQGERVTFVDAPMEDIDYLVIEPGVIKFDGDAMIVAGKVSSDLTYSNIGGTTYKSKNVLFRDFGLNTSFASAPGVLVQLQTKNNYINGQPLWLSSIALNPTVQGFSLILDRSEVTKNAVLAKSEDVAFVAGLGQGFVNGRKFWLGDGSTRNTLGALDDNVIKPITEGCLQVSNFPVSGFKSAPVLLASKRTRNGNNGGWLRRCSVTKTGVALINEEDMQRDSERGHVVEPFSYFLFDKPPVDGVCELFPSPAQTWSSNTNALLQMSNRTKITGAQLSNGKRYVGFSPSSIDIRNEASCDGQSCLGDSGLMVKKQELESFRSPDEPSLNNVTVWESEREFSNNEVIGNLSVGKGTVTFKTGIYWVASIDINNGGVISIPAGEKVTIHIKKLSMSGKKEGGKKSWFKEENTATKSGELVVLVHGSQDSNVLLSEDSEFVGLLYSESDVKVDNNSIVRGAVTARQIYMTEDAQIIATDNHCFTPSDNYEVTLSPATQYALMCGTEQPSFEIETKNDGYVESTGVTVQVYPDADKFSVEVADSTGTGTYPSFTTSNVFSKLGKLKLQVTVTDQNGIELNDEYTLKVTVDNDPSKTQTSTFKFVPFKFDVDDQAIVAGKNYQIETRVLACSDGQQTVVKSYTGSPSVQLEIETPADGRSDASLLAYEPKFIDSEQGKTSDTFKLMESGLYTIKLEDANFTCDPQYSDECPIAPDEEKGEQESVTLNGSFSVKSRPWKIAACNIVAKNGGKTNPTTQATGDGFIASAESFNVTYKPIVHSDSRGNATNVCEYTLTQNYFSDSNTAAPLDAEFSVLYPSGGDIANLDPSKGSSLDFSSEEAKSGKTVEYVWDEVGALNLKTKATYLGEKLDEYDVTVGRFYPDYFKVTGTEWTYPDNQNDSVYMGQNFASVKFEVTAYNADGYATQNYGSFADSLKADLHLAGSFSDRLSILDSDLTSKNWSGAIWSKTWVNSVDWSKAVNLDGPFNSKVSTDSSTESSIALSLNNTASTKTAHIDPTLFLTEGHDGKQSRTVEQQLLSQPDVRYGRMVLDDIGGRQGDTLSIPLKVEYWNKNRFVVNSKDNRTAVSAVEQGDDKLIWSSPDGVTACDIDIQVLDSADSETSSAKVTGGILPNANRERLTAVQGCDNEVRQQSQVWLDLDDSKNGLPWLKYNWDNKKAGEENPSSVVTFGIHRGNDRVIYRGEPGLTGQ